MIPVHGKTASTHCSMVKDRYRPGLKAISAALAQNEGGGIGRTPVTAPADLMNVDLIQFEATA